MRNYKKMMRSFVVCLITVQIDIRSASNSTNAPNTLIGRASERKHWNLCSLLDFVVHADEVCANAFLFFEVPGLKVQSQ